MRQPAERSGDDSRSAIGSTGFASASALSWTGGDDLPEDVFDLTCPACGSDLTADACFLEFHVCGFCHRHFSIQARDRIGLTVDPGSFIELTGDAEAQAFENVLPDAHRMWEDHDRRVIRDAVVTGTARIGGVEIVVVALDDHLIGASIGAMMAEKVIVGFELARVRRCPVLTLCAGGSAQTQSGPLAAVQSGRLAASAARLHMDGVPIVAVLTHPTSGWIFRALASHGDLVVAEPGSRIGIGVPAVDDLPGPESSSAESLVSGGWVDEIVDRTALRGTLTKLFTVLAFRGFVRSGSPQPESDGVGPASWQALAQLRNPNRPDGAFYLSSLISSFTQLRGDRVTGDDPGTVCGVGRFESVTVAIVVLDYPQPAEIERSEAIAARKVMRLAKLAGRLELPLLILIGGGQSVPALPTTIESAQAVASLSGMLAMLPVPIMSVAIAEVRGALATSLISVDRQFMQDNAVLTSEFDSSRRPSRPSSPASYPTELPERGSFLTARECLRLGLIDGVIGEGDEGAHANPHGAVAGVRATVLLALVELTGAGQRRLLETRHQRQRSLGQSTPEGLAAARSEIRDLQEWQHSLTKAIDEWRGRWEQRRGTSPKRSLHRPDLGELADRLRSRRVEMLDRTGRGDRSET